MIVEKDGKLTIVNFKEEKDTLTVEDILNGQAYGVASDWQQVCVHLLKRIEELEKQ